jgi:Kef-type K+ transport system membrane component KefB
VASGPSPGQITELLAVVGAIALAALAIRALARRVGQPAVIGEMSLGVLAGPTLLHGAIGRTLITPDVRPLLSALANLGLALFMFLAGLELGPAGRTRGEAGGDPRVRLATTVIVALGATVLPATLGGALGLDLAGRVAGAQRVAFVVFIAAAMSVTAFPVLVRILRDRAIDDGAVGQLALRTAAIADVVGWLLLAVAVLVSRVHGGPGWRAAMIVPYGLAMTLLARPVLRRIAARAGDRNGLRVAVTAGALCSAALTSWMGLHPVFGAFLFGAIVPRDGGGQLGAELKRTLEEPVMGVLVPIYFVTAGLAVDAAGVGGDLGRLALVLLVAVAGKFCGTFVAARVSGLERGEATTLGLLMNTRGLTELIVLSVGLQAGVIGGRTYSVMVAMALITTAMTGPLLSLQDALQARRRRRYTIPARSSSASRFPS